MIVGFKVAQTTAYFTDVVENELTFSAGKVKIKLEQTTTNWYGDIWKDAEDTSTNATPDSVTSATYDINTFRLIPGKTYIKNPTVIVKKGSSPSYIFVKVENGLVDEAKGINLEDGTNTIASQLLANNWHVLDVETHKDVYYYYKDKPNDQSSVDSYLVDPSNVEEDINITVFENFKIKDDAVVPGFPLSEPPKMSIKAYAIQGTGFTTFTQAWDQISTLANEEAQE